MKKLATRDTLRHLKLLMEAAPGLSGVFKKEIEASAFATLLERLRALVAENGAEPSVESLRATLFPHAQTDSRRVLFSNFRGTLTRAAEAAGRRFALVQPNLRGKATGEIACWFEGDAFPDERELPTTAATEKLDELVQADARTVPDEIRVFISFANADRDKVAQLKKCLEATWGERRSHRVKFWTFDDPKNGGILAGENNQERIKGAMAGCPIGLFLLSPPFSQSTFIREHELPAYFPATPGRHPVFVNLRNSKPPAAHLAQELLAQNIFSLDEKSFDDQRGRAAHERFATALNDHLELICKKHFSRPDVDAPPAAPPVRRLPREQHTFLPQEENDCHLIDPAFKPDTADQGVDAVADLLAWADDPERAHYFALLGETGAGKTTILLMFARRLNAAKGPVRAYLFDLRYANYDGLLERTANRPKLEDIMNAILRRGGAADLSAADYLKAVREERAVLIFDGLDEIFVALNSGEQDSLMRELMSALPLGHARREGAGKLLLACRTQYYRTPESERGGLTLQGREGFDTATAETRRTRVEVARVLPFTEKQIHAYFDANLPSIPFAKVWKLLEQIHELTELATRPYLLNLIRRQIPMLNTRVERNEPVRAVDLYRGFVEDWGHERNKFHNILLPEDKSDLMEALAVHMWRLRAKSLRAADLERWLLDALVKHDRWRVIYADHLKPRAQESLLSDFRTASFVSRWDGDTFRFAHTSLQEYFLACHLGRALRLPGAEAAAAWDLPPPSIETLDFLGQLLQGLPAHEHVAVIARLNGLLGDATAPAPARLAAFRYHLQARRKGWPAPECPDLALAGLDLSGMEVRGFAQNPLRFGAVDVSGVTMTGASFEYMHCRPGALMRGADLRGSRWVRCDLHGADFSSARVEGVFFRQCDLRETRATETDTSGVLLHLCETSPDSPWPVLPPPGKPVLRLQYGHTSAVESGAFSPDGHHVLSGSHDKTLKLWNIRSGHCIQMLTGHSELVGSVVFSPDGQFLASGSWDTTIKCWDVRSGRCHQTLTGHSGCVTTVAFSADSHLLISGSQDKTIRLWDMRTMQCLKVLKGHSEDVMSVAFSRDGRHAISGSKDQTIKLWDVISCQCLQTFTGHSHWVNSVAFSPDGELILSGSEDDTLKLWDTCSGQCLHTFKGHSYGISSVCFSPDGRYLLSASDDATLKVWDVRSRQCTKTLAGHSDVARSIAISHNENLLTSGSGDCTLKLWDTRSGQCLHSLAGHSHTVICATFSPEGGRIFCLIFGENDHCFSVGGQPLPVPEGTDDWFSPDSNKSGDLQLEVIGGALLRLRSGNTLIRDILPLPDGKSLVLEPLDAAEAVKPPNECRWKLVRGPADAWRHAAAIDLDTLAVHPLETVAPEGSWEVCD